jgi:integrase
MPKPRKNEIIKCRYYTWKVYQRANDYWYADGRSKMLDLKRKTLETRDFEQAKRTLEELDRRCAEQQGLAPIGIPHVSHPALLTLAEGRERHESFITQPRMTGGLTESTQKKYRSHYDKFIPWATAHRVEHWNEVDASVLRGYAAFLKSTAARSSKKPYADKSVTTELTFLKGLVKWFIREGHLCDKEPIALKLAKPESQRPYCYTREEVAAMVDHCLETQRIAWMADVIIALACTGLRISELAGLRWSDIDMVKQVLVLTRQAAYRKPEEERRVLKSKRSRTLVIAKDLRRVLQRLPRHKDGFVFHGPRGGRLKDDFVRRRLISQVLEPLKERFPAEAGEKGFADGRLHSFRHYFCSVCANNGVPEQMLMTWMGHRDSEMVRHYYHLNDGEARRQMDEIDFLAARSGCTAGDQEEQRREDTPGEKSA